jgi:hypothetical protein
VSIWHDLKIEILTPPSPTRTVISAAETARIGTKAAMAVEKRILERDQKKDYGWKGLYGQNWNERACKNVNE